MGSLDTRVTGELGGVGPLVNVRPQSRGNKQPVQAACTGARVTLLSKLYPLLDLPGDYQTGGGQDGCGA